MIKARCWLKKYQNQEIDDKDFVYLVPELCNMVGQTEAMWLRKISQREIKKVMRVDAPIVI